MRGTRLSRSSWLTTTISHTFPVSATAGSPYSAQDIDAFIVALPEKVFYPADAVDKLEPALFKFGPLLGLPAKEDTILRTSSRPARLFADSFGSTSRSLIRSWSRR